MLFAAGLTSNAQNSNVPQEQGRFQNNWESLKQWECPEWFKDAKFGLWAHWGPQCQAESGDWYARFMYYTNNPYDERRGIHYNPAEYGLKEFCRDWKAAKWNPEKIMAKYKAVGCKYFMTLGNHHDNFDLWNSPYQEWNSVNMGPERDIVGEWAKAARDNGLRLGVSIHASHAWTWLEPSQQYDGNLTKAEGTGKWWEGYDPQELYAQRHAHSSGWENSGTIHSQWDWGNGASIPSEAYKTKLQNRCRQMVNDYNPDMVYFDDTVLPFWGCDNQWGQDFLAHYYNHSANQHDGNADVVVCGKILPDEQKQLMLWDVERGIPDRPRKEYWQTCTCIGDWHYKKSIGSYKSAATVVRMLIDVVSKNGNLLLSIPLNADGEYDSREAAVLDGIEAWMKINGESIYGTRTWDECFGEGPLAEAVNNMTAQGFNEGQNYTSADVRYVTKGDTVYATIMAWPSAGEYLMKAFSPLAESYHGEVAKVELLGYGPVEFRHGGKGLVVNVPSTHPNDIAPAFRITFKEGEQSNYQILQSIVTDYSERAEQMLLESSDINSGKYNTQLVSEFVAAIEAAKTVDASNNSAVDEALAAVRAAYNNLDRNGINKGGVFISSIATDMTRSVLVEAENFSGTLGGRYGSLTNWTVENYNIPKGGDGNRQGLDNYGGTRGISLGVWDDRGSNKGDLSNARIYRKVTLKPGTYYFGAAYNSLYGCSEKAYMFVSTKLSTTDKICDESIAWYQVNTAKEGSDLYGLYFRIAEEQEVYIGWQADLNNGSAQQEFRATKVQFYETKEVDQRPTADKLNEAGWQKLEGIPADMDFSANYFAMVERRADLPITAKSHADNGKNWGNVYVMQYAQYADPNSDTDAVWVFEGFDSSGKPANGTDAKSLILTSMKEQSRQFRTEGWSKVVWQTYSDFGGSKGDNDGNRKLAYLHPEYSEQDGFLLKNETSAAYIGPWDDAKFEDGQEFAANKSSENAADIDIYYIPRTKWVAQYVDLSEASDSYPIDMTCLLNNPSFERYDENLLPISWTVTGSGVVEKGYLPGCNGKLYMNNWQASGKLSDRSISQTVKNLPAGKYQLKAYGICEADGAYLFAGDEKVSMKHTGEGDTALNFVLDSSADLAIGVMLSNYQNNNFKYDNIRLYYVGANAETSIPNNPTHTATSDGKRLEDGRIIIVKDAKKYNTQGLRVK